MKVETPLDEIALLLTRVFALGEVAAGALARFGAILGAILIGWIAYRIVIGLIDRLLSPLGGVANYTARAQRARTLNPLLASAARYVIAFIVTVVVLSELGIDVRALMVSAGVIGLAIGLGAQSLIKDVITGFFILFENLIAVGDVIEVGSHSGVVEAVGLRVTKIRKFSGELRIVPNGELTAFGHHSAGWARAVVEVSVGYGEDITRALRVLEGVGHALREAHPGQVLEPPVAEGILRFQASDVVLRLHARVDAQHKFPMELELRRRVKEGLDAAGIEIPYPQQVVHVSPDHPSLVPPREKESRA
ncbi:MAG TPA: mechanosensitive ion channel family protein [Methylomirabilota bacterium]|jgi:small conductance mechanosensitive channel|nr:mechanosensitive ion channel family protein [Methylomirabilota bacterium]